MQSESLILVAIEPAHAARGRLASTIQEIGLQTQVDVQADPQTGRIVLGARDEEQLRMALALLHREAPRAYSAGAPQVAYRHGLAERVEVTCTHKKQSGGSGEFAAVKVRFFPGDTGQGIVFADSSDCGSLPQEYIQAVEKSMRETAAMGSAFGLPLTDVSIELVEGRYHDQDSSAPAFEIAGREAMREAVQIAGVKLLEPIMKVEVVTPEEFMGDVIGDLNSRRGQIQGIERRGNAQAVDAFVPLATLLGYVDELRSLSRGRAECTMHFSHFAEVPDGGGPPDTEPTAAALRA